ncbi:unnamed protein product [Closterium sp. Yama58-4]|nr:unnamed protein product [Closterium sp. Yama58-4]
MRSSSGRANAGAAGMGFTSPRDADAAEARRLQRAALLQARGGPNSMEKQFLRFISAGTFLDSATLSSVAPILPGYARRFGLTQHAVTLLLAARNVTSVLASLPIGVLLLLISVPTIFAATFSLSTLASLSLAFPLAGAGSLAAALVLQGVATQSVRSVGLFFAARVCGSGASLDEVVDQLAQKGSEGLHKLLGSGRLWTARGRTSLSSAGAAGGGGSASEGLFVVRSGDQVFRSAAADYSLTGTHFPTAFADGMDGTPSGSSSAASSAASSAEASLLIGVIGSLLGWASLGTLIGPLFGSFAYQYLSPWIAYLVAAVAAAVLAFLSFLLSPEAHSLDRLEFQLRWRKKKQKKQQQQQQQQQQEEELEEQEEPQLQQQGNTASYALTSTSFNPPGGTDTMQSSSPGPVSIGLASASAAEPGPDSIVSPGFQAGSGQVTVNFEALGVEPPPEPSDLPDSFFSSFASRQEDTSDGAGDHARPSTGQNVPQWYYQDWAGEHGPRTLLQLTQALQKGYFTPDLLVRKEGTQRWHTLRDVLDLRQLLRARKHGQAAPDGAAASTGTPSRTAVSLEAATAASAAALAGISPRRDGSPASATSAAASAAVPVVSLISADDPITNLFKTPGQEWFYVDMHGEVQGPFSSQKMQRWWTNPLYKDHFSSLKCRRGHHGEFRLLPEIAEEVAARGPPPESPKQLGYRDPVSAKKAPKSERYVRSGSRKEESDLAKEVEELKQQVERLEMDNEGLRNSQEDTFILRMQVERLLREKAELAREVTMLKREKESLQELLQYAQQFDIADEGVADELIAGEEGEGMGGNEWGAGEGDRATEEWFQMLEAASHKNPNGLEEN